MKEKDLKIDRRKKPEQKASIQINIRITKDISGWLKKKGFSPTAIFYAALKEIGYK